MSQPTPHIRFGIAGGTGEEVAVFDLYAGTGGDYPERGRCGTKAYALVHTAKSIVAKNIAATTLSGAPVRVMCNSAAVRSCLPAWCF